MSTPRATPPPGSVSPPAPPSAAATPTGAASGRWARKASTSPLFRDDDGSAYLLSESRTDGLRMYRLSADYLTVASLVTVLDDFEAPAMFKIGNRYYLLG